jgi:hypothetical protein
LIPRLNRAALVFIVAAFGAAAFAPGLSAQTATAKPAPPNRYLFIVDTSFSMHSRAMGVQTVVANLLLSGMNGQMRRGDTLGVWTFNEKLYAGRFPLQRWSPEARQVIAQYTLEYLAKQRYEKKTELDDAIAAMGRVIENSDAVTVIIISDADDGIKGTPFDAEINAIYKQYYRQQKKARMPFTTILRAEGGQITDYKVNMAAWPLELPPLPPPPLPPEPQITEVAGNKPTAVQPKAPAPVVPPLILSGKSSTPSSVPAQPAAIPKIQTAPATPETPAATPASPIAKTEAAPQPPAPATVVAENTAVVPAPKTEPVTVPETASVQAQAAKSSAPTIAQSEMPIAEVPAPAASIPSQPAVAIAPKIQPAPATPETPIAQTAPAPPEPPMPPPVTEIAQARTPSVGNVSSSRPNTPAAATMPQKGLPDKALNIKTDAQPAKAPVQTAVAVPPRNFFSSKGVWIAGLVLVLLGGIAAVFVALSKRRSRTTPQGSLITYSLDRDKK